MVSEEDSCSLLTGLSSIDTKPAARELPRYQSVDEFVQDGIRYFSGPGTLIQIYGASRKLVHLPF